MHVSQLTLEQEKEIIRDRKLLLIALCALNQLTLEQIVDTYSASKTECIQLLIKLDRIKFLELLPNNQVKLLVARTFSWLPEGPIQQYFKARGAERIFPFAVQRAGRDSAAGQWHALARLHPNACCPGSSAWPTSSRKCTTRTPVWH